MLRRLLTLLAILTIAPAIHATNAVWISQSGTGTQSGLDSANTKPYSYFNLGGSWSATPSGALIGPDTTAHLTGTISGTGGNGATVFGCQGNGTSGHPVTVLFESGASIQAPRLQYAFSCGGRADIVINGGTNGFIQNTLNGSTAASSSAGAATCPAGPCTIIGDSTAIYMDPCTRCEVKNLTIANIYVHKGCLGAGCDITVDQTQVRAVMFAGDDFSIHDNVIHDVGWAVWDRFVSGDSNHQIYNNNIYNMDHGFILAGLSDPAQDIFFHDNHLHDMAAWDTGSANAFHHDGIHAFGSLSSVTTGFYIYNNLFDGNMGNCCITSWAFLEGGSTAGRTPWTVSGSAFIFNNIFIGTSSPSDGQLGLYQGTGHQVYNNVFFGPVGDTSGKCIAAGASSTMETIVFKNNVVQGCNQIFGMDSTVSALTADYNIYGSASGGNPIFQVSSIGNSNTLAGWQSACSCDSHSTATLGSAIANIGASTGLPTSSFAGIATGVNLTGTATGNLAPLASATSAGHTAVVVARPTAGAWDKGAYELTSASPPGPPPVTILSNNLPNGTVGTTYPSTTLIASGGTLPYTWTGSSFPPGLALSAGGVLSGMPTLVGAFQPNIKVTDSLNVASTKLFQLSVSAVTPPSPTYTLTVSPTVFGFAWSFGSPVPSVQTLTIRDNDPSVGHGFTVSSNQPWLQLGVASGTTTGAVSVRINTSAIGAAGVYNGIITVTAPSLNGSPKAIPVTLTVTGTPPTPPSTQTLTCGPPVTTTTSTAGVYTLTMTCTVK